VEVSEGRTVADFAAAHFGPHAKIPFAMVSRCMLLVPS
jgi:hypothetical protein